MQGWDIEKLPSLSEFLVTSGHYCMQAEQTEFFYPTAQTSFCPVWRVQ